MRLRQWFVMSKVRAIAASTTVDRWTWIFLEGDRVSGGDAEECVDVRAYIETAFLERLREKLVETTCVRWRFVPRRG